jgi:hypothetical protein
VVTDRAKGLQVERGEARHETKALDATGKRAPADKLLAQAAEDEAKEPIGR